MTQDLREALEKIITRTAGPSYGMGIAIVKIAEAALSTKQEGEEERSRSQTAAPFGRATQKAAASTVVARLQEYASWTNYPLLRSLLADAEAEIENLLAVNVRSQALEEAFAEIEYCINSVQGALRHRRQPQDYHFHTALKACRDGRAALIPLPAPDAGWRTMETAPKDGTLILLYEDCVPASVQIGQWQDDGACWVSDPGGWSVESVMWLPLPALP